MKYYIIVGEASGDLHASNLIKALKQHDPQAQIRALGGDKMAHAGATIAKHYQTFNFMGFWEVILNIRTIFRLFAFAKKDMLAYEPDAVILVDYSGFNLRMAKFAKQKGFKTYYYISPKVWAWKKNRIETIRKYVDMLFVIFPFEVEFFRKNDLKNVLYVGNPLLDELHGFEFDTHFHQKHKLDSGKPIVALLAGSRRQEVEKMLPTMLAIMPSLPEYQFCLAGAPSLPKSFYEPFINQKNVVLIDNQTYDLLQNAQIALVASGTATLETALIGTPQVVCYRGNPLSIVAARWLIKNIKYISLVNLILDKAAVLELIQGDFTVENLLEEMELIKQNGPKRLAMLEDYEDLKKMFGNENASQNTAKHVVEDLKKYNQSQKMKKDIQVNKVS